MNDEQTKGTYAVDPAVLHALQKQREAQTAALIWQLESQDVIGEIENFLRGIQKSDDGKTWEKVQATCSKCNGNGKIVGLNPEEELECVGCSGEGKVSVALMSDEGVNNIIQMLRPHTSKIPVLSNIPDKRINEILLDIGYALLDWTMLNYDRYSIRLDMWTTLGVATVMNLIEFSLRRGGEGFERLTSAKIQQYIEHRQLSEEPKKKGLKFLR